MKLRSVKDDATQRRRLRNFVEQSRQLQSETGSCRVKSYFWCICPDIRIE